MNEHLLSAIESARRTIRHFAASGIGPARTLERQLDWCWDRVNGLNEGPPPAPLCMSWLMEQAFERYGAYPLLAHQLRAIEEGMGVPAFDQERYAALAA